MTDDDLTAIKARAEAATPGPWDWWVGDGYNDHEKVWTRHVGCGPLIAGDPNNGEDTYDPVVVISAGCGQSEYTPWRNEADAAFIAHARTDVPALVAEIGRLRHALDVIADGCMCNKGDSWAVGQCSCQTTIADRALAGEIIP